MLKPMGKKHMLDEWCGGPSCLPIGPKLPVHLRPLIGPTGAAMRLQLRYQKYQDKVRAVLKKRDARPQPALTAKKTSGRVVTASSMALAIAVQTKDQRVELASLHLASEPMEKWTSKQDETTFQEVTRPDRKDLDDVESDDRLTRRRHAFVNVMEPTWLLSSVAQRCAAATRTSTRSPSSQGYHFTDVRIALLDVLFVARAGTPMTIRNRYPSSVQTHYHNLLTRVHVSTLAEQTRVLHLFEAIKSDMVLPAVRCLGYVLTKTWRRLFDGLHVDVESLDHVRRVLQASKGDVSLVFAPTHKSHFDYLIISYLCFAYGMPLPRIAAGDNLNLPLVGTFLRANGSFFIRRSFRDDPLYKRVLEQYVHELLDDGAPIEVFLEGTRSRHGRVCKPQLGFMSMFVNYVRKKTLPIVRNDGHWSNKTVLVVPISLDYDRVYEADGYANQLLGKPKEKESLAVLLRSVCDLFFVRLGHSYVRFGEPIPLTDTSVLVESADLVAERMQRSGTITSTAIVSALLMWKRAYMTTTMLEERTLWLVNELEKRGATVAHVDNEGLATHALSILNVETTANGVITPHLQYPVRALEFGFYRNHVLHLFLPEMAVIGALDTLLRQCSNRVKRHTPQRLINIKAVKQEAQKTWRYLRHLCRHAMISIDARVDALLVETFESCCVDEALETVAVSVNQWYRAKLVSFVLSLNWSFMDSWWLTTQGLWSLLHGTDAEHTARAVARRVQLLAKELFLRQQLFHAEAFCSESIKQTLDFFAESGVVRFEQSVDGKVRVIRLESDVHDLHNLTREVNARRKPRVFLWRQDESPRNLTRQEALALMEDDGSSIYAEWMAPQNHK